MTSFIRFASLRISIALFLSLALGATLACRTPVQAHALVLSVSNRLGRTIVEIREKPCGDLELAFVPIEGSRLGPGETRGIELPSTCVDLVAFDSRGRVVGEQRGLTMVPGARWVLRR